MKNAKKLLLFVFALVALVLVMSISIFAEEATEPVECEHTYDWKICGCPKCGTLAVLDEGSTNVSSNLGYKIFFATSLNDLSKTGYDVIRLKNNISLPSGGKITNENAIIDLGGNVLYRNGGYLGLRIVAAKGFVNGYVYKTNGGSQILGVTSLGFMEDVTLAANSTKTNNATGLIMNTAGAYLGSMKNVTICAGILSDLNSNNFDFENVGTNGIYNHGIEAKDGTIGSMENVKIATYGQAITSAAKIGTMTNCVFSGDNIALNITTLQSEMVFNNCEIRSKNLAIYIANAVESTEEAPVSFEIGNTKFVTDGAVYDISSHIIGNEMFADLTSAKALVNGRLYTSLEDAVNALNASTEEVTTFALIGDLAVNSTIVVDKKVNFSFGGASYDVPVYGTNQVTHKTVTGYTVTSSVDVVFKVVKDGDLTISGDGLLKGTENAIVSENGGKVLVAAGTYEGYNPATHISSSSCVVNNNGKYNITSEHDYDDEVGSDKTNYQVDGVCNNCGFVRGIFAVDNVYYGTFDEAFAAASASGKQMVLASDLELDGEVVWDLTGVTFNFNNLTVTGNLSIVGGTFTSDASDYLADGYCNKYVANKGYVVAKHELSDATCTKPATCPECGESEGEALGHSWTWGTAACLNNCGLVKFATIGETIYATFEEAIAAAQDGDTIVIYAPVEITTDTTYELNNITISSAGDVFVVTSGTLTLKGNFTVNAGTENNGSWCAIWANGGNVVVNGGTYSVGGDNSTTDVNHQNDLVYTKNGGTVTINGGTFIAGNGIWALNQNDKTGGDIVVYGGTFVGFNPANNVSEGANTSFVADGYCTAPVDGGYVVTTHAWPSEWGKTACQNNCGEVRFATIGETIYDTFEKAIDAAQDGDTIVIYAPVEIKTNTEYELNNITISSAGDVFVVTEGTLTLSGNFTVNAGTENTGSWCAIWANGGNVVVNGGTYSVGGDNSTTDVNHQNDLVYTKNGGTVTINGGTFIAGNGIWALNQNDKTGGDIVVYGGTFVGFNPANNVSEGANTSFVADGYCTAPVDGGYVVTTHAWPSEWGKTACQNNCGEVRFATIGETIYDTFEKAIDAAQDGDTIVIYAPVEITTDTTYELNNITISSAGDVFVVTSGTLTLKGNFTVNAGTENNGSWCAIWANGGNVVVNGGTYSVGGDNSTTDVNHQNDLVYTKNGGTVTINGGTFIAGNGIWALNQNDKTGGDIVVYGGTFVGFNPANNVSEGANTSFVADGYCCANKADTNNYIVAAHNCVAGEPAEDGSVTYTCANCGETYVINNAAVNGEYYLGTDKVVFANGVLSAMGGEFNYTYNVTTGMIDTDAGIFFQVINGTIYFRGAQPLHQHVEGGYITEVTEPTCTDKGYTTYICQFCGPLFTGNEVPATGHNYVETGRVESTTEQAGHIEFTCEHCGDTYTEDLPLIEHTHTEVEIPAVLPTPSNGHKGSTAGIKCSECDATIVAPVEFSATELASDHAFRFRAASVSLDESISINYKPAKLDGYNNVYVVFVFEGVEYIVSEFDYVESFTGGYRYSFKFSETGPELIASNIDAYCYAETADGFVMNKRLGYSIQAYLEGQLKSNKAELTTVISNLLVMCSKVQLYMGVNTDNLIYDTFINNGYNLTPTAFSGVDTSLNVQAIVGDRTTGTDWKAGSLVMGASTEINFKFETDNLEGLKVKVVVGNGEAKYFDVADLETETTSNGKTRYIVNVNYVKSYEFNEVVTATFERDGVQVGSTVTYSVNSYLVNNHAKSTGNTKALIEALYVYGMSANSYFGK